MYTYIYIYLYMYIGNEVVSLNKAIARFIYLLLISSTLSLKYHTLYL